MAGNALAFEFVTDSAEPAVVKDALISPCGLYRYWLTRVWNPGARKLPIIMLNPSTADAAIDDPTIGRCMSFARREGFGGIRVVNLFSFRATSPDDMKAADDPIGPDGSAHIEDVLRVSVAAGIPVLCAWGAHGGYGNRDKAVLLSAEGWGADMVCLGTTKEGHPRHPLYVRGDQPFEPFA